MDFRDHLVQFLKTLCYRQDAEAKEISDLGIPWWSSGWDSALPLQGPGVRSLVRELRSHKLHGAAKKKEKKKKVTCPRSQLVQSQN